MRRRYTTRVAGGGVLALLCATACFAAASADAAWSEFAVSPDGRDGQFPSLANVGGVPYAAYVEAGSAFNYLRVSRLDAAGRWELVGGDAPLSQDDGAAPSLASVGGTPYVAYDDGPEIRVKRLDASRGAWEPVGGEGSSLNMGGEGFWPTLAVVRGVPYVAFTQRSYRGLEILVSRLDESERWQEVGDPIPIAANSGNVHIAAARGVPYLAWSEWNGSNLELQVSRLNAAGTGWQPVGGPLNHASDQDAMNPSITSVGGIPYVAWDESDGAHQQIRASRLNASGTGWEEVVGGPSPINHDPDDTALHPSIAAIGDVPYVAWSEGATRVARLSSTGTAWDEVAGGASPEGFADHPSLTSIGGVPYVAWEKFVDAGVDTHLAVEGARLEPDFLAQAAVAGRRHALLATTVRTYGVSYPIAFQLGSVGLFDRRTRVQRTPYGLDEATIVAPVGGLAPGTRYSWRPIGFDGSNVTGAGRTGRFRTIRRRRRRAAA